MSSIKKDKNSWQKNKQDYTNREIYENILESFWWHWKSFWENPYNQSTNIIDKFENKQEIYEKNIPKT